MHTSLSDPDVDMEDFSDVRSASSMGEGAIRLLAFLKKAGQVMCSSVMGGRGVCVCVCVR